MYRVWDYVTALPGLFLAGCAVALSWANLAPDSYAFAVHYPLWFGNGVGTDATAWLFTHGGRYGIDELGDVSRVLSVRFVISDMLMALVFAIAAKEVWEAVVLDHGALRGRHAALPVVAMLGGMAVPALLYLGLTSGAEGLARGWAVPTTTDLALAYIVGRAAFGAGHPALRFLVLMALCDDAVSFAVMAIFYPVAEVAPGYLAVAAGAALAAYGLANRLPRLASARTPLGRVARASRGPLGLLPFALAGAVSWWAVQRAGLPGALGLLPIVPTLPHADRAFGVFSAAEALLHDPLNRAEMILKRPAQAAILLFGVVSAGVTSTALAPASGAVALALLLGKPAGIVGVALLAMGPGGLRLPAGMGRRALVVAGTASGVGGTMSLYLAHVAHGAGTPPAQAAAWGVLLSLAALPLALVLARGLGSAPRGRGV